MLKWLKKNNLDEMQEQKLLKIESRGFWLAFWGLLAAILVQSVMYEDPERLIGELIVFTILALYVGFQSARNGIWDRKLKADGKTNAIISGITAVLLGVIMFAENFARYRKPIGSLAAAAITAVSVFILCFIGVTLAARYTKRRQRKLEAEPEDTDEEK